MKHVMKILILNHQWMVRIIVGLIMAIGLILVTEALSYDFHIRCSEDAIICARILERNGYHAYISYGEWLGKGYPPGTDHAQALTVKDGKITWWVLVNNRPVKTEKHHFVSEHTLTWQEAVKVWWDLKPSPLPRQSQVDGSVGLF